VVEGGVVKKLLFSLMALVSYEVEAQTFVAPPQEFLLTYYQDSDGYSLPEAVSELGLPASEPRSFRVKIISRKNIVYADSWGSRLKCSQLKGGLKCEYRGSFTDETSSTPCRIAVVYAFSAIRRTSWSSTFQEQMQCSDGWFRVIEYSGRAKVRIRN
jgi:hypothetical protein